MYRRLFYHPTYLFLLTLLFFLNIDKVSIPRLKFANIVGRGRLKLLQLKIVDTILCIAKITKIIHQINIY